MVKRLVWRRCHWLSRVKRTWKFCRAQQSAITALRTPASYLGGCVAFWRLRQPLVR